MAAILGISPGMKFTGLVIVRDGTLVEWKVRRMRGKDASAKRDMVRVWVESSIEKYQVEAIAMKIVPSWHCTDALDALYSEIRILATHTGIFLSTFTMETLRQHIPEYHPNKRSLFQHLATVFPKLELPYSKFTKSQQPYYAKLFEALACTLI